MDDALGARVREMKLWLVYADTHDYDCMSQWPVGIFSSKEKADAIAKSCERAYWKAVPGSKKRGIPNVEVTECILDEVIDNG